MRRKVKRILIQAVSAKSGGAATYLLNLSRELASVETEFNCVLYVPSRKLMGEIGGNVAIVETEAGYRSPWQRFFWDQVTLRRIIKKSGVDLLLSSSDFGMLFPPCRQILMIRNPLFFSDFYLESILPQKSWSFRMEFLLRRKLISLSALFSDLVVTASHSMLEDVRRFISIPDGKAVVNHFGVPIEKFNGKYATGEKPETGETATRRCGTLRLLYVSEYSDYKNLTTLLRAILVLREQGIDDFCLTTTADPGQFPDVEITSREIDKGLVTHPRVSPYIKIVGSVPYEKIETLYRESDLFVFPSLAESFGHPLVEAMASGLPIVASDIPIHREVCGEAAVYFAPLQDNDLADKIMLLRNHPELRERLGRVGRKRANTRFEWKDHVQRLVDLIDRVAARAQP